MKPVYVLTYAWPKVPGWQGKRSVAELLELHSYKYSQSPLDIEIALRMSDDKYLPRRRLLSQVSYIVGNVFGRDLSVAERPCRRGEPRNIVSDATYQAGAPRQTRQFHSRKRLSTHPLSGRIVLYGPAPQVSSPVLPVP